MSRDAELLHSRLESGRFQPQKLGSAAVSADAPTYHLQNMEKVVSLHLLERLRVDAPFGPFNRW